MIIPNDTLWGQSHPAQTNCILSAKNPYFSFYPYGMKRTGKLIDYSDSILVFSASTQWRQESLGFYGLQTATNYDVVRMTLTRIGP
ncbi:MAG: hypothetical protein ACKO4Y_07275 [Flavobacteriales bacterium]